MKFKQLILLPILLMMWLISPAMPLKPAIQISNKEALIIAVKIWYNESGGRVTGLTSWNDGEDFASLGIGHFIWYPAGNRRDQFSASFPGLIRYLEQHGALAPAWLQGQYIPYCPWDDRAEFIADLHSPQMMQLRRYLLETIPLQARYIALRLELALPRILNHVSQAKRPEIKKEFYRVAATPKGVYALVDYVNFKGEGLGRYEHYNHQGWGLLQVLQHMQQAPADERPIQQFVWAANVVLTRRVQNSPAWRDEQRWLPGWRNRLHTYL